MLVNNSEPGLVGTDSATLNSQLIWWAKNFRSSGLRLSAPETAFHTGDAKAVFRPHN
jgi:hypothetical protein